MYFIDVQGTLIDDNERKPISGALDFINYLNNQKIPYVVITNNTKYSSDDFLSYLQSLGFKIQATNYIDPLCMLKEQLKGTKLAVFGDQNFINIMQNFGVITYENPTDMVIGITKNYTNEDYATMIELALQGVNIVGMHETSIYAKNNKQYPGIGAILKMISFASNQQYSIVGKPSEIFYLKAKSILGAKDFNAITIISDDIIGDILGAKKLGMRSVFVLSGKIKNADHILPTLEPNERPDHVYQNIAEFLKDIQ